MPLRQLSSSDSSVGASSPRSVCVSSRLRCVAGGSSSSSLARSTSSVLHVAPAPGPGCARQSSAARRRRRGRARRSCALKPASEATCSCSHSLRCAERGVELPGRARACARRALQHAAAGQRARRRTGSRPGPAAPARRPARARRIRSGRAGRWTGPARPGRQVLRRRCSASSSVSARSAISSLSVTVPGVTTRTTLRSTGPLAVATSPTCSATATASPSLISRAR